MDIKYFLSLAACMYASTAIAETNLEKPPTSDTAVHGESDLDIHQKTPIHEDAHTQDSKTNDENNDDEDEPEEGRGCGPSAPTVPKEEPPSKELQQEEALIERNAYFDDYMCPRPFIISSTEF